MEDFKCFSNRTSGLALGFLPKEEHRMCFGACKNGEILYQLSHYNLNDIEANSEYHPITKDVFDLLHSQATNREQYFFLFKKNMFNEETGAKVEASGLKGSYFKFGKGGYTEIEIRPDLFGTDYRNHILTRPSGDEQMTRFHVDDAFHITDSDYGEEVIEEEFNRVYLAEQ